MRVTDAAGAAMRVCEPGKGGGTVSGAIHRVQSHPPLSLRSVLIGFVLLAPSDPHRRKWDP